MESGGDYDVFVSYARSDGPAAAELNRWLCARGLSTFFDRSALRPGLRWVPALEDAMSRSKAVAILVGPHGLGNTQQYEREFALIRQTGDPSFPVIPVMMPGCDSPPTGFLKLLTWIDLSKGKSVSDQAESLEALRAALRGETAAAAAVRGSICPYRGLEPFREEDAAFFCGRDDAIGELSARVREHAFVAVVGPSGSGKSSLVFAGLIPALRREGRTTMWDVVTLRPGKSPLRALAEAFGTAPDNAGAFEIDAWLEKEAALLRSGDAEALARAVDRRIDGAPEKPDRLLIYVDQWEELYAMAPPPEDKDRLKQHSHDVEKFISLLLAATSGTGSRASFVMTVRADFYNPLIRNPRLAALLPKQQVNIPPMSRDDLRAAIETPARTAGLSFAPTQLVDRILDDVGVEEGRLPLLQFALKETWEKRAGEKLTAEAYAEVGGVAGAINKTAQGAYDRLTPAQQDAARRLFLRLVTPGEGQADTRARSLIPDDAEQREIINLFANPKTRLLVTGAETLQVAAGQGSAARATVEIAHEALIQRWPTLRAWVNENREKLRDRTAILRFEAEWEENGENEKFLLDPGVQLERGRALLEDPGDVPVDDLRDYVSRSVERDQRRLDAEREADLADQKRIADAERQAREGAERAAAAGKRTTRVALGGLVAALLVAAVAVWQFFVADQEKKIALDAERDALEAKVEALEQRNSAATAKKEADANAQKAKASADDARAMAAEAKANSREAQITQSRFLADQARQQLASGDAGAAALLTLEALPDAVAGVDRPYVPEAELQLDGAWRNLRERLVIGHEKGVISAEFSPDGKRIVTGSYDHTARIWDAASGKPIGEPLRGHEDIVISAAFSHDGKRIVTASQDKTARQWDAVTGQPIGKPLEGHDNTVNSAAFSSDGKRIVTASSDGTARMWDGATGKPIGEFRGHTGAVISAAFSPDNKRIVTASMDKTAQIWDAASGKPIGTPLKGHEKGVTRAAFSPDGKRIVTASMDTTARIWDATSGQPVSEPLKGHDDVLISAAFSPDGKWIVTASWDKTARLWDAATGKQVGELKGHNDKVIDAAFSPDSKSVVTASYDKTARVWRPATGETASEPIVGHYDGMVSVAFSPEGAPIVAVSNDNTVRVWNAANGQPVGDPLKGPEDSIISAGLSPDGKHIVTAFQEHMARIWDAATGNPIGEPLKGHEDIVRNAAFSADGTRVVTVSDDKTARIWDAATGKPIGEPLRGHDGIVYRAAFSPDGKRIVTASEDNTARIWDAATGKQLGDPLKGHRGSVMMAAFNTDGKRIVTASEDNTARLWDAATGQPIGEPLKGHKGGVNSAEFSPDGARIITASDDGTARIWDTATGKPIGVLRAQEAMTSAAFSPDGKRIITGSDDDTARIWDVFPDTQTLVSAAKNVVPRCLAPEQRNAFFLPPEPPDWCIEMAKWPYDTAEWKQWLADRRAGKNPPLVAAP